MANSFNSKEIIKIIPNKKRILQPDKSPARVIRGLYVAGVWRPPHYIDRTLIVDVINAPPVEVVPYTTKEEHTNNDYYTALASVTTGSSNVVFYSTKTENIPNNDYYTAFVSTSFGNSTVTQFTTESLDIPNSDYYTALTQTSFGSADILYMSQSKHDIPPGQPSLQVTSIVSEHTTVTQRE